MVDFRASLDTIDKASATRKSAITERMGVTDYLTKKAEERQRYQTEQISSGLDGIGKAIRAKDEDKRSEESHASNMEAQKMTNKFNKETYDARTKTVGANLKAAELGNEETSNRMEVNKKKAKLDEQVLNGKVKAAVAGKVVGKDYPKELEGDQVAIASYIDGTNTEKDRVVKEKQAAANLAATQAGTSNTLASTDNLKMKGEIDAIAAIKDMDAVSGKIADITAKHEDPSLVSMPHGTAKTNPAGWTKYKEQEDAYKEQYKKSKASYDNALTTSKISNLIGAKLDAQGNPIDLSGLKFTGGKGAFAKYSNDPEYAQAKNEMVKFLKSAAASGTYGALNFPSEIKRAYQEAGGEPLGADGTNSEAFVDFLFTEGKTEAFFATQASARKVAKNDVALYLSQPENTTYLGKKDKIGQLAYMHADNDYIIPEEGNANYTTAQDFVSKTSGPAGIHPAQYQMNLALGPGAVKLPSQYLAKWDEEAKIADPVYAQAQIDANRGSGFNADMFTNPKLKAIAEKARNSNISNYAQEGAKRLPTETMITGGDPTKQTVNPATAAPSMPIYVDAKGRISPVSSHSGVAAAGATPSTVGEYHKNYSRSTGFNNYEEFQKNALGSFGASEHPKSYGEALAQ